MYFVRQLGPSWADQLFSLPFKGEGQARVEKEEGATYDLCGK